MNNSTNSRPGARYALADPRAAANGPQPIEPAATAGDSRCLLVSSECAPQITAGENEMVAEFTEERNNRQLGHIARRLLLPDSYVEACYDLQQFISGVQAVNLEVESVQRNLFKCLKICARLSKINGYSIQLMWQVIQQAHERAGQFIPERARTIGIWYTKLTNRIRMMALSPAADGSAPPRLPLDPPAALLQARNRDKLLPLPTMSVGALRDQAFNRSAGISSASYYLRNPISQSSSRQEIEADSEQQQASRGGNEQPVPPNENNSEEREEDEDGGGTFTQEAELAIIERQLRELEHIPTERMGPMLRAALNLLVEMRFRLQLGLPRRANDSNGNTMGSPTAAVAAINSVGLVNGMRGELSASPPPANNNSSIAWSPTFPRPALPLANSGRTNRLDFFAAGTQDDEERIIEYVLEQISTSRRRRAQELTPIWAISNSGVDRRRHGSLSMMLSNFAASDQMRMVDDDQITEQEDEDQYEDEVEESSSSQENSSSSRNRRRGRSESVSTEARSQRRRHA